MLTQKSVKELFQYNEGDLIRKVARCNAVKKGDIAGCVTHKGYIQISINGKSYQGHRVVFLYHYGYLPEFLDHIDGDPLNNKIENLRECTTMQNAHNAKLSIANTSGVKGVYWDKSVCKWHAQLSIDGKVRHIGFFNDIEEAKAKVKNVRDNNHGEFVCHG